MGGRMGGIEEGGRGEGGGGQGKNFPTEGSGNGTGRTGGGERWETPSIFPPLTCFMSCVVPGEPSGWLPLLNPLEVSVGQLQTGEHVALKLHRTPN